MLYPLLLLSTRLTRVFSCNTLSPAHSPACHISVSWLRRTNSLFWCRMEIGINDHSLFLSACGHRIKWHARFHLYWWKWPERQAVIQRSAFQKKIFLISDLNLIAFFYSLLQCDSSLYMVFSNCMLHLYSHMSHSFPNSTQTFFRWR